MSQETALNRPPLACPCEVMMLFQVANESCQTKSHFKSTLCKKKKTKIRYYSTFHLLITLWIKDQSSRNLSVLEINGVCGYLNPWSPFLECNSLGKNSFPDFLPPPTHTHIRPNNTEEGDYSASDLRSAITWAFNILLIWNMELFLWNCPPSDGFLVSIIES